MGRGRGWAPQITQGTTVYGPYAEATAAPVHERDVAAVAVRALTSDDLVGSRPAVSGPESLSHADQVRLIGETIGRDLQYVEIPPDVAREQMVEALPEPVADALLAGWESCVGRAATVEPTVQRLTGHSPQSFQDWVGDHLTAFSPS